MPDAGSPRSSSTPKTYYLPAGLHQRLKAAWWATREMPTLSALVSSLIRDEAARLEDKFNKGSRFPAAKASLSSRATRGGARQRHTYYIPADVHTRLVAAWVATKDTEQAAPSVSALVSQLLEDEAMRLEREHNAGAIFSPAPDRARGVDPDAARRQGTMMAEIWRNRREAE